MSRNTPPCGEPRPALISALIARATSSRGQQLGRAAVVLLVVVPAVRLGLGVGGLGAEELGDVVEHEPLASELLQHAAVAAHHSVTRMPRTDGGQTIPVGWNWTNSMSIRSAPAHSASAWPSPVYSQEFEVIFHDLPMPPVASTTAFVLNTMKRPVSRR